MTLLQSIILGIIQGLAEFLPISSSAHLILVPWLLKWQEHTLVFDVALHLGTFSAIAIYFFRDYLDLLGKAFTRPLLEKGNQFWNILIAVIPAVIFGILLENYIEKIFRGQILIIALLIMGFGIIIFLVDTLIKKEKMLGTLNIFQSLLIGLSQALALFPGVSRSGVTITTGMLLGFKREDSARFSFLLSGPVILGAGLLSLLKHYKEVKSELIYFTAGFLTAAIVGFLVIHFLLNYLKKRSFTPFVVYRFVIAIIVIVVLFVR